MGTVGMAEEESRLANGAEHRHDIPALVLEAMRRGGVRFAAAAARYRVYGESTFEEWLYKLPVRLVIAEGAMHEQEWGAASVLLIGNLVAGGRDDPLHESLAQADNTREAEGTFQPTVAHDPARAMSIDMEKTMHLECRKKMHQRPLLVAAYSPAVFGVNFVARVVTPRSHHRVLSNPLGIARAK
jgi:hypothetical protein